MNFKAEGKKDRWKNYSLSLRKNLKGKCIEESIQRGNMAKTAERGIDQSKE